MAVWFENRKFRTLLIAKPLRIKRTHNTCLLLTAGRRVFIKVRAVTQLCGAIEVLYLKHPPQEKLSLGQ